MKKLTIFPVLLILLSAVPAGADCYDDEALKLKGEEIALRQTWFYLMSGPKLLASTPQKITLEIDGITFDSAYDNGSLLNVTQIAPNEFNCTLYSEPGELGARQYWFRFTMTGVAGRTLTLNIPHDQSPQPVIRLGDRPWRKMTAGEAPNGNQVVLSFGPTDDQAEISFFFPLGVRETYERVGRLTSGCVSASTRVIGSSFQGRDMWMVTVNDSHFPDADKRRVWIHSRAHAGEVTSTFCLLGFLERITEGSLLGNYLRQHFIFNIIPLQNIDGVWLGHTRWDSQGIDPERQWPQPERIPEVSNLKQQVDSFMAGSNPVEVALNMHSTTGNFLDTFFWKHVYPSVTRQFEDIEQDYIDAFDQATPLFDNLNPQTSQLSADLFIESYFWNNWAEAVMAMTHEGHFRSRITDWEPITDEDYLELGRAQADALIDYFGLPGPTPTSLWRLY